MNAFTKTRQSAMGTIFVVDDDVPVLRAMSRLLKVAGYDVRPFTSAAEFLAAHDPSLPGCAILDLAMPEMDGLQLQAALAEQGLNRSVVFLTGQGDIRKTVIAMKSGAADFLVKPVRKDELLAAVNAAIERDIAAREREQALTFINERLNKLTARQRQVLLHVVAGRLNKQIAAELGTTEKTVKVHRARMMARMGVRTVAELVRLVERIGIDTSL